MKQRFVLAAALSALCLSTTVQAEPDTEARAQASRAAIKEFAATLKGELQAAMKAGGPTQAISVCQDRAPEIAASISKEKGWDVGRTSLKLRNPANQPDAWELAVLKKFEERKAAGEPVKTIDYSEIVEIDGRQHFRYMKAIPTQAPCLNCHGTDINPAVVEKLDKLYPQDKARGFSEGDIRGAFTITQPM